MLFFTQIDNSNFNGQLGLHCDKIFKLFTTYIWGMIDPHFHNFIWLIKHLNLKFKKIKGVEWLDTSLQ